jgi:hypothetical protein
MLMPHCPSCRSRLPLQEVFDGGGIVCPHCHGELEPFGWVSFISVIIVMLAMEVGIHAAQGSGLNFPMQLVSGGIVGVLVGGVAYVFLVRYRIKAAKQTVLKP